MVRRRKGTLQIFDIISEWVWNSIRQEVVASLWFKESIVLNSTDINLMVEVLQMAIIYYYRIYEFFRSKNFQPMDFKSITSIPWTFRLICKTAMNREFRFFFLSLSITAYNKLITVHSITGWQIIRRLCVERILGANSNQQKPVHQYAIYSGNWVSEKYSLASNKPVSIPIRLRPCNSLDTV